MMMRSFRLCWRRRLSRTRSGCSIYNAVLSPDGRYMLMAAMDLMRTQSLYIHDFDSGVTGKLDVTSLGEIGTDPLAFASVTYNNHYHRGMHWLNNNRLLVDLKGVYRIYELAVIPK